jgi:hypothetical protein
MKSDLRIGVIKIVIPRTQIPMWFNKQNAGSSISMDPLPNMDDNNLIGVAYCFTIVAHDDEMPSCIWFDFRGKRGLSSSYIFTHLGNYRVTVDLDHLCLLFFTREMFIDCTINHQPPITDGFHDIIEFEVSVEQPFGLHLEIKSCGYRWIFKEDLEQLNSQMYLTND